MKKVRIRLSSVGLPRPFICRPFDVLLSKDVSDYNALGYVALLVDKACIAKGFRCKLGHAAEVVGGVVQGANGYA